jgi:hypothetical protein
MNRVVLSDSESISVTAHVGASCVLLAISVSENATEDLAGFAVYRATDSGPPTALLNRINFDDPITSITAPQERKWTPSDRAPIQKFRCVDVPPAGVERKITYGVRPMYFPRAGGDFHPGRQARVAIEPGTDSPTKTLVAFTRSYICHRSRLISSFGYTELFRDANIRPRGTPLPVFDTIPFKLKYEWLGGGARKVVFEFLEHCRTEKSAKLDVFAYDLDEPDIIARICEFGREKRLRAVLDNGPLHMETAVEVEAARLIVAASGEGNVVQAPLGHHPYNRMFIERDESGSARRVLFGSMNFSIRGMYVHSNYVVVTEDEHAVAYMASLFDDAFVSSTSPRISWNKVGVVENKSIRNHESARLQKGALARSPHIQISVSTKSAAHRIQAANSSVLYLIQVSPEEESDLTASLRLIADKSNIFSYGIIRTREGLSIQRGDRGTSSIAFTYLKSKLPHPFGEEFDPDGGRHLHSQFIVIDFNGHNPAVIMGLSDSAVHREPDTSLTIIEDRDVATIYAVEALKIFDHYSFRDRMRNADSATPVTLWRPDNPQRSRPWWKSYYDSTSRKFCDRRLFAGVKHV